MSPWIELIALPVAVCVGGACVYLLQRQQIKLLTRQVEQRDKLIGECAIREQKMLDGFMGKIGIHTTFNEASTKTIDRSPRKLAELRINERKREANEEQWERASREFDPSNEGDSDEG